MGLFKFALTEAFIEDWVWNSHAVDVNWQDITNLVCPPGSTFRYVVFPKTAQWSGGDVYLVADVPGTAGPPESFKLMPPAKLTETDTTYVLTVPDLYPGKPDRVYTKPKEVAP